MALGRGLALRRASFILYAMKFLLGGQKPVCEEIQEVGVTAVAVSARVGQHFVDLKAELDVDSEACFFSE
jgi:hypothetical protein